MDELPGNDTLFLIHFNNGRSVLPKIQGRLSYLCECPLWVGSGRSLSDLFPTICSVPESFLIGLSLFYSRQLIQSEIHILPIG